MPTRTSRPCPSHQPTQEQPVLGVVLALGLVAVAALASGCVDERTRPIGAGVHPVGWGEKRSPAFHATWLADNGDDLTRCRACHGDDYRGGAVGVSCATAECHAAPSGLGPEACGTCHGACANRGADDDCTLDDPRLDDPRPATGAHRDPTERAGAGHDRFCAECHVVPEHVTDATHIGDDSPGPDLTFSGVALANDATPTFDGDQKSCAGVYCHVAGTPRWTDEEPLQCSACHLAPPDDHARFRFVAADDQQCRNCHADPRAAIDPEHLELVTHVNGTLDLALPEGCGTCHGDAETGAPPRALDGAEDADQPGVGAHQRHLNPDLPDRVAAPVACTSCHVVPTEDDVLADGHIDTESPADVVLPRDGTYDPATRSCVVWCHYNRDPGPVFTDDSGDARACDGCHEAPPASHARFAFVADDDESCATCHPAPPADTHIDGTLDLALPPDRCDTCHGTGDLGGPPPSLSGSSDARDPQVGAHRRHLDAGLAGRIGRVVTCDTCHEVPAEVLADGHIDDTAPADVRFLDGGQYFPDAAGGNCTVSCHWDNDPGPRWNDDSGNERECGACHSMPPAVTRDGANHPAAGPDLADCVVCHTYAPETHVDGEVTF